MWCYSHFLLIFSRLAVRKDPNEKEIITFVHIKPFFFLFRLAVQNAENLKLASNVICPNLKVPLMKSNVEQNVLISISSAPKTN